MEKLNRLFCKKKQFFFGSLKKLSVSHFFEIRWCDFFFCAQVLRLSRSAANETAGGLIINLLSNDVARFDQLFVYLHYIWIMPIQGALVAYLIWQNVEIASLAGIFLITIQTIPFQGTVYEFHSFLSRISLIIHGAGITWCVDEFRTKVQVERTMRMIEYLNWELDYLPSRILRRRLGIARKSIGPIL